MSYGFHTINDFGTIQIDEEHFVLQVSSSGSLIAQEMPPRSDMACVFIPLSIFNYNTDFLYINYDLNDGRDFDIIFEDSSFPGGTLLCFDQLPAGVYSFVLNYKVVKKSFNIPKPLSGYGLAVQNTSGEQVFNSSYPIVNNLAVTYLNGTGPYKGRTTSNFYCTVPSGRKLFFDARIFITVSDVVYVNSNTLRVGGGIRYDQPGIPAIYNTSYWGGQSLCCAALIHN